VATWLHTYCLLGTPLLDPERGPDALAAILARMRGERVAFAGLEWIPAEGPVAAAIDRAPGRPARVFDRFARATLRRRPQNDYLEGVKGKHRREFRRLAKGLADELGGPLELVDRAGEPAAVEEFLRLEASGWKGRRETALAADPAHAGFFRSICRDFAARGALELLFLEGGGQAAAARCSLLAGGASFCFKVAYDERFRRYSPGRELELRLIDRFHADTGLSWMDSCADRGNELYPRLWPDRRELRTTVHPAPSWRRRPPRRSSRPANGAAAAVE
jgi:CelD/BcsL family acetyltransferase involved in cellulose biosynthesis